MVERIGTCRVLGEIGSGGMAIVYEAIQEPLNRRVAIKALKPSIAIDSQFAERFEREAQVLASFNDPHIAGIHQIDKVDTLDDTAVLDVEAGDDSLGQHQASSSAAKASDNVNAPE